MCVCAQLPGLKQKQGRPTRYPTRKAALKTERKRLQEEKDGNMERCDTGIGKRYSSENRKIKIQREKDGIKRRKKKREEEIIQ